jgi:hypothetical protein
MRFATLLLLIVALLTGSSRRAAARDAAQAPPSSNPGSGASQYAFATGAGVLFFHVKPERLADFEAVVARIRQVLDTTTDPARRQQADGWRIYKSMEMTSAPIYVFMFDPATTTADYDPIRLLGEAMPIEVPGLYAQLKDATVKVERMGLTKVR